MRKRKAEEARKAAELKAAKDEEDKMSSMTI